jgi:hypothetical protein
VKRTVRGIGEAVEVDNMLWGWRWRHGPGKAVEVKDEAIK